MATLVDGLVVPAEAVEIGVVVRVKAGEAIPVDGVVVQGRAAVDESALTGKKEASNVLHSSRRPVLDHYGAEPINPISGSWTIDAIWSQVRRVPWRRP